MSLTSAREFGRRRREKNIAHFRPADQAAFCPPLRPSARPLGRLAALTASAGLFAPDVWGSLVQQ